MLFQAKMEELEKMMMWIREQTVAAGFSLQESRKIELALEEAIVNIIHYAYHDQGGPIELSAMTSTPLKLGFVLKDRGPPFNPLMQANSEQGYRSLEETKEGGLGISVMRYFMDEVHYERKAPYNILTLIKHKNS
jgi:serine/threonine-protein kinase RsbW